MDYSKNSHGSCVASLAAGVKHGVSKESELIVLKSSQDRRDTLWAFTRARDLVAKSYPARNTSVILFTAAAPLGKGNESYWIRVKELIQQLFDNDAVVVVPAGNYAFWNQTKRGKEKQQIDTIPAAWASPDFPLIVAGAVDSTRTAAKFTQGPNGVTAHAPGVDVSCAKKDSFLGRRASGTSYSAAMIAGLVAYYLSFETPPFPIGNGQTARGARNYLQSAESSWSRMRDATNVIWNGQDGSNITTS